MVATLADVVQAEPDAIERAFPCVESLDSATENERARLVMLITTYLPEIAEMPARVRRIVRSMWEWMAGNSISIRQAEESRAQLVRIFDSHISSTGTVLAAARKLNLSPHILQQIENTLDLLLADREQTFLHWKPFTEEDMRDALQEVQDGKIHDLDEIIRELQDRLGSASPA